MKYLMFGTNEAYYKWNFAQIRKFYMLIAVEMNMYVIYERLVCQNVRQAVKQLDFKNIRQVIDESLMNVLWIWSWLAQP